MKTRRRARLNPEGSSPGRSVSGGIAHEPVVLHPLSMTDSLNQDLSMIKEEGYGRLPFGHRATRQARAASVSALRASVDYRFLACILGLHALWVEPGI